MLQKTLALFLVLSSPSLFSQAFITTWKTDNPGSSNSNQITIPVYPTETYNYSVDWGDGMINSGLTGESTHTYATPGTYQVSITGNFPGIFFGATSDNDRNKILTVEQWGSNVWGRVNSAFNGCNNLDVRATDMPDLSDVTSTAGMFISCHNLVGNNSFANWNTSTITDMNYMFYFAELFNQDISSWDVSNVRDMNNMFNGAGSFNQEIGNWNVGAVTTMNSMFQGATSFNADIGGWDVSSVENMIDLFLSATSFNQDIGSWNVSNVQFMADMFRNAVSFNQDIGQWNVGNVLFMPRMFSGVQLSSKNYDALLQGWASLPALQPNVVFDAGDSKYCEAEVSRQQIVNNYGWTISDAGRFCPFITTWKTDNPGVSEDNQITIPTFPGETYDYTVDWGDGTSDTNVSGDITHTYAVPGTYQVSISGEFPQIFFNENGDTDKLLNIKQWGDIAWRSMESAFAGCRNLSVGAIDTPNLSNTTSLRRMFFFCIYAFDFTGTREFSNFNGIENFNFWDVSTITDMSAMFDKSSFNQDISSWDVSSVEDMSFMFFSSTFNSPIDTWDVRNVRFMNSLFGSSLFNQDISSWNVGNVQVFDFIFNSTYFNNDITGWNVENAVSMRHAFSQSSFDQDLSSWNISNVADLSNAFDDSDLSRDNYDAILTGWAQLPNLQPGVVLGANDAIYCLAENDRNALINNSGWTINDYGRNCEPERPFITTWKTDNPGPSGDNQITIPTNPREVYNYRVDWGDGSFNEGVTGDITHTYAQPGQYQVAITGKFPRIYFNGYADNFESPSKNPDDLKIVSVDQWGTNRWNTMSYAFAGCENLDIKATDIPDFSRGVTLNGMFLGCSSLVGNASISDWTINEGFGSSYMFKDATNFNIPIGNWDISSIRYMRGMFENATAFDQDLGSWNVENVEWMFDLFKGSGLSNRNYNKILIGWSQLTTVRNGVQLDAPENFYCNAEEERQRLIDDFSWIINDAGANQECLFTTTWKTDNPGISADNQITIPTFPGEIYDYTIDWGDGTSDTNVTGDITHTYAMPGTYQVTISGDFPRIYFNGGFLGEGDSQKILTIENWGSLQWSSMEEAFEGCLNLDMKALDLPDFTFLTRINSMFRYCTALQGNPSMEQWDVSGITAISFLFERAELFNQDIGNWDVSNVVNMTGTFLGASSFNQDISGWNVGQVTNMNGTFDGAEAFNQDIGNWNVGNVREMGGMFADASSFNQDIGNWDVSNANYFEAMFLRAASFNQDIGNWNMGTATNTAAMFFGATAFNQDVSSWNISNVTDINSMFGNTRDFNQDLSSWDVSNVTNMIGVFSGALSFNKDISSWDVSNVENMEVMFNGAAAFDQNLGSWDVSNVADMRGILAGTALSIRNYDKILIGWSNLPSLQNNVEFNSGLTNYCLGETARSTIIDTYGWTILDGGKASNECENREPFVTLWKTDNPGGSEDNQITIPTFPGEIYAYDVDWGDGTSDARVTGDITHSYTMPGTYKVQITGDFPRIYFFGSSWTDDTTMDNKKLISVEQWGYTEWSSMEFAFLNCTEMDVTATDTPILNGVSSLYGMFTGCYLMQGATSFADWKTGHIIQMTSMFESCFDFNQDLSSWDVSNVTDTSFMFSDAQSFDYDLSSWDVGQVTHMQAMFQNAEAFNQDIGDWDVSAVTDMSNMFSGASSFNQNIGSWDVGQVTNMHGMFSNALSFDRSISGWNVSRVNDMGFMFFNASSFDQSLGDWDMTLVSNLTDMFTGAGLSTQNYDATLSGWAGQLVNNGLVFNAGDSRYCEAADARQFLIDTYNWTITDSGETPLCNEDNDSDGVQDHKDNCLNSLPGATVDENGCDIIPNDAIKVLVLTPSCAGGSDGAVEITMDISGYLLDIVMDGDGGMRLFDDVSSGTDFVITDLAVGSYSVTISIPEILFEQTYGVTINELEAISGKRQALDVGTRTASYTVSGSYNYKVSINGETTTFQYANTEEQTLVLKNLIGQNEIVISGESDCQGKITDSFFLGASISVFPTITSDAFSVISDYDVIDLEIYSLEGRLISAIQRLEFSVQSNKVDVSTLPSGMYLVKMRAITGEEKTVKIIKR